uniref:Capsid protein n=2 Tax=unclassified Virgaviridae TaxID=1527522 RepID=A0A8F5XT41_9VIRU|nr:putative coat protein [Bemisia tabaci virga-like virus 2]QXP45027.1 hypothetical protein [Insect virga-like virus 1]
MSYVNWTPDHDALASCRLVPVAQLARTLNLVRHTAFSVKAERDEARNKLIDLRSIHVDQHIRFPVGAHVDLSYATISELIDKMMMALDHGEREMDRESFAHGQTKFTGYNDSKVAFIKSLQSIMQIIVKPMQSVIGEGVYSRETFEQHFNLIWVDDDHHELQAAEQHDE